MSQSNSWFMLCSLHFCSVSILQLWRAMLRLSPPSRLCSAWSQGMSDSLTSWLYNALLKNLMSKAVSISHFGHSQSSGLRRLLHHPLETAGFNELGWTKLRLKSSRLSVPISKPNRTGIPAHCWPKKQGKDLTCTRCRMGDIGNNAMKSKEHYRFWKLTFSRCCQAHVSISINLLSCCIPSLWYAALDIRLKGYVSGHCLNYVSPDKKTSDTPFSGLRARL